MGQIEKKAQPDWERIEQEYRAGLLSVREIASKGDCKITEGAIRKRAKRDGWERDLGAKIKARADALVRREEVRTEVRTSPESVLTDRAIIEANAEVIAGVRLAHRKDIARARKLAMALLTQLESQTLSIEGFDQLGELLAARDLAPDRMLAIYNNVIALPGRTKTMKDLADTLHKLIGLEREAYNIGDQANDTPPPPPAPGIVVVPADAVEAVNVYLRVMAAGGQ